ncbi:MAG TPA: STAS domain-containing protein, partial [Terriglobales bacterium]
MLSAPTSWHLTVCGSGDATIVRLRGKAIYLHESDVERLHDELFGLAERMSGRHLVVDLSDVLFLTSTTVEVLLALRRHLRGWGGRLSVCNPTPAIRDLFEALQLDQIFDVHVRP